ncbi:MAG: hypothetical protein ACRD4U_03380, partial [Candidatus Acidiferrales bacterium]
MSSQRRYMRGWLLDLYPAPEGMVLWVIDAERRRTRLVDSSFTPCFYVAWPRTQAACSAGIKARSGEAAGVRGRLAAQLAKRFAVRLAWTQRRDFWSGEEREVLEVGVQRLAQFDAVVRWVNKRA